ncbi:fosfomycin resistance protein FosB [Bacillus sp. FJAT-18019]|nr:fosfomycin resistance protein FosB [Bacillus sp. FJAT-18019]
MNLQPINHLCFSVAELERSVSFYKDVFGAKLLVKGRKLAYFDLNGLWVALNEEQVDRSMVKRTYTHIAFSMEEHEYEPMLLRLQALQVEILPGRSRDEKDKRSIYFLDPDGHMFEFHTGDLKDRLDYYRADKEHMTFYDIE